MNKSAINIRLFFKMDFVKVIINFGGPFYAFPYLVHYIVFSSFTSMSDRVSWTIFTGWFEKLYRV